MSILGISQVHQKTIRELQAKIDALEAELKSSKLMYLSLGSEKSYWKDMTVDQKTSIEYLEAMLDIACAAVVEVGSQGFSIKLKEYIER